MHFHLTTSRYDDVRLTYDGDDLDLKAFCPHCRQLITTVEDTDSWGSIRKMFDDHAHACPKQPDPGVAQVTEWFTVIDYGDAAAVPDMVTPDRTIAERYAAYVNGDIDGEHEVEVMPVVTSLPPPRRLWRGEWDVTTAGLERTAVTSSLEFLGLHQVPPGQVTRRVGGHQPGQRAFVVVEGWNADAVRRAGNAEVVRLFATGLR